MGFDLPKRTTRPPAQPAAAVRLAVFAAATLIALLGGVVVAYASWGHNGSGGGAAKARTLPTGSTPTTTITGRNVTVSWSASSYAGGGPSISDYVVKRYNTSGVEQTIGSGCSGTISALTCTESNVDAGDWKYTVTPKAGNWTGTESSQSATRTVNSPSFTLSGWANVNSLPSSLNGNLADFKTGATITYRLDNPTTGTVLSATTTPSTIGTNGSASVSVTIPSGTSNGSHTVYAVSSLGGQATAKITVNVCASPGTVTALASQDSYADQNSPTNTFGTNTSMSVQTRSGQNRRAFVQFNLPSVPSGCSVTSATLQMFQTAAAAGRTIQAQRVTGSWDEATVNWNNQPGTTTTGQATTTSGTGARTWSVTSMVKRMYTQDNYGFMLRDSVEDAATAAQTYQSEEGTTASQDPQLLITFGNDNDARFTLSSSSTVTSLTTTLSGDLSAFTTGSTVIYRLDDPDTGTVLSGSTTPSTIGATGAADASVTVPKGTTNGSHKIYAVSSSGDVASVSITVDLPSLTTPAWGLKDVSSGTAVDQTEATAYDDNRVFPTNTTFASANFNNTFTTTRYYGWQFASPLPTGQAASNVTFDFRFRSAVAGVTSCFYFDVIDGASTIGTHGSTTPGAANSQWCTDATEKLVTTSLPEVTTTDIVNGLQIKVYGYSSGSDPILVDQATVSGTYGASSTPFSVYEEYGANAADGSAENLPWLLGLEDGESGTDYYFTDANNWGTSFDTTKYVELTFPSYVPSSADVETVSFKHRFQSGSGSTVCYYIEAFSGGSSLGTTPSSPGTNGQSCVAGTASWVSETVPLNGVNTPGKVNGLVLRLYYRTSSGGATKDREDYTALQVTYD